MSAALALQAAMISSLTQSSKLTGVYHDTPARAPFPYCVLVCSDEKDWSCKGREGREIAVQLVLWDEQPARLLDLERLLELSPETLNADADWHLSSLLLTGKRRGRNPGSPWSCAVEYRARLLSRSPGETT